MKQPLTRRVANVALLALLVLITPASIGLPGTHSIGLAPSAHDALNRTADARSGYDLSWRTVDNGGATFSVAGKYELGGTVGQIDARPVLRSDDYTLAGGFWPAASRAAALARHPIYLPLVLRHPKG